MSDQITRRVLIDRGLQSLDVRVQAVMEAFAEMLCLVGRSDLARHLPWLDPSKLDLEEGNQAEDLDPEDMAQLYSIAFQLLDMVEERVAMNIRRERERTFGASAERGLWSERLQSLKDLGVSESDIAAAIPTIEIEPVFTAHPTEAKRASVRERHRVIYQLLLKLEYDHYTSIERDLIHGRLLSALEALWFTGETHLERPTVKRELRNTLFYLREMFPDVVARLDQHLIKSWEQVGFDPQSLQQVGGGSRTRFGIWIGGDRDGHPFVTAEVTADTLALLRQQSLKLYRRELSRAAEHLTVSLDLQPVPKKLASAKKDLVKYLGKSGKLISKRHREEPWRAFCHLLGEWVVQDEEATPEKLREYIELIEDSLSEVGCVRLGAQFIQPLKRMLDVFGFHLASLDIRQNSAFHDTAAEEILVAAGVEEGATFSQWSEEKRVAFLTESLESASPLLPESSSKKIGSEAESIGEKADAVRDCYKVLATHWENYSDGLGSLIVSMTRQLSDLLLVHFFAREFGLVVNAKGGGGQLPTCPLQVVPLLETLGDLDGGAEIVSAYLRHPVAQRSLAQQSASSDIVQQVMLGYSDSNKDAGILASQVGLHRAQDEIYAAGQAEGVEIRFFHGRGGTVSRGAGPVQWFVNSLPKGSLHRGLRMTEQGETIATKYTHLACQCDL